MDDISFLFEDPRPDLPDTLLWDKLLKAVPKVADRSIALELHSNLWSMRSAGVILARRYPGTLKFEPIIGRGGDFDSVEFFDEMKRQHLLQFSPEIKELLREVSRCG